MEWIGVILCTNLKCSKVKTCLRGKHYVEVRATPRRHFFYKYEHYELINGTCGHFIPLFKNTK